MDVAIVSLGTELVTGQTVDTNASWLGGALTGLGAHVRGVTVLPDVLDPIVDALREATAMADLVVVTGGLGPTADDLTRIAIATLLNADLVLDEPSLAHIRTLFADRGRTMPESNHVQAMIPAGAAAIPNPIGTAPGIRAKAGRATLVAMPGVPGEMRAMFDASVRPLIAARAGATVHRRIHTFGLTESDLGERIADLMTRGRNPDVGTAAKSATITVRLHAHGADEAEARARADADVATIRSRLGLHVVGVDDETLPVAVGRLLVQRGETLATAESCTGGWIAKRIVDVPGSSVWFTHGYVTYADSAKRDLLGVRSETLNAHGAVSAETVVEMAEGARTRSGADWAIAVSGIAGPGGGTDEKPVGLVHFGFAHAGGTFVHERRWGHTLSRTEIRSRTAWAALNWLRLALLRA